jgi:hypothetical protein
MSAHVDVVDRKIGIHAKPLSSATATKNATIMDNSASSMSKTCESRSMARVIQVGYLRQTLSSSSSCTPFRSAHILVKFSCTQRRCGSRVASSSASLNRALFCSAATSRALGSVGPCAGPAWHRVFQLGPAFSSVEIPRPHECSLRAT